MRKRTAVRRTITSDEYRAMVGNLDTRYPSNRRTRAMLALMYLCGLRCGEVCALGAEAVDLDAGTVTVGNVPGLCKSGGRVVGLPASDELDAALRAWIADRDPASPYMFATTTGKRVQTSSLRRRVSQLAGKAGLVGVHPHTLRHSYAHNLLAAGVPLPCIQSALGHANLATTDVYLRVGQVEQIDATRRVVSPV